MSADRSTPGRPEAGRNRTLDGIRGWAALMIVAFHMTRELFGAIFPFWRSPLLAGFVDGNLAVAIFFVLSGAALSLSFFRTGRLAGTLDLAIKRWPRLFLPILAVTIVVALLVAVGAPLHHEAAPIVRREDWMDEWLPEPLGLREILRYSLFEVFDLFGPRAQTSPNPFLWTMKIELLGSFLVFGCLVVLRFSRPVGWTIVGLIFGVCVLVGLRGVPVLADVAAFLFGMGLADLATRGALDAIGRRIPTAVFVAAVAIGFFADGQAIGAGVAVLAWPTAMVVVFSALASPRMRAFLDGGPSQFLGRISYPLFLVQFPVIVTATSFAVIAADRGGWLTAAGSVAIALGSMLFAIGAARLFEPIDVAARRACNRMVGLLRSGFGRADGGRTVSLDGGAGLDERAS